MKPSSAAVPLTLLSVVIPARDEEGCIASTVEHLRVELSLRQVPHEIVVVDDGSTDRTWEILTEFAAKFPEVRAIRNEPPHGFGRAVVCWSRSKPRRRDRDHDGG